MQLVILNSLANFRKILEMNLWIIMIMQNLSGKRVLETQPKPTIRWFDMFFFSKQYKDEERTVYYILFVSLIFVNVGFMILISLSAYSSSVCCCTYKTVVSILSLLTTLMWVTVTITLPLLEMEELDHIGEKFEQLFFFVILGAEFVLVRKKCISMNKYANGSTISYQLPVYLN